jgi:hypothetical protein
LLAVYEVRAGVFIKGQVMKAKLTLTITNNDETPYFKVEANRKSKSTGSCPSQIIAEVFGLCISAVPNAFDFTTAELTFLIMEVLSRKKPGKLLEELAIAHKYFSTEYTFDECISLNIDKEKLHCGNTDELTKFYEFEMSKVSKTTLNY